MLLVEDHVRISRAQNTKTLQSQYLTVSQKGRVWTCLINMYMFHIEYIKIQIVFVGG